MLELLRPGIPVLAVQLYWASIVFIGWTLTRAMLTVTKGTFVDKWVDLPLAAKLVIVTAAGFLSFSLFTVIGYALSLPAWWLPVSYLGSLAAVAVYWLRQDKRAALATLRSELRALTKITFFSPLGILLILGGIELGLTFFIGGFMGGDGFVHVSKIRHLLNHGFTLTDAYYGTAPETRHTVSVIHTLIATPSWFGINPITSWYASAAFFKFVRLAAIFYLAWRLLYWTRGAIRVQYASLATIVALAMFNNYFISYPSIFVTTWVMLFTVVLLDVARHRNYWLLGIASVLIAVTHPVASLAMAILLLLVAAAFLIFDRKFFSKKVLLCMALSFVILLSTPVYTSTLPNRMTDATKNFSMSSFAYYHVGSLQAFRPAPYQYFTTDTFIAMPWMLWLLSLAGVVGLFVFVKDRRYRIILGAIFLYVPIVLYNPVAFTILKKVLPVWGIARFTVADQLMVVTIFFGLLFACFAASHMLRSKIKVSSNSWLVILTGITLVLFGQTQTFGAVDPHSFRHASMYTQQQGVYQDLSNLSHVLPDDNNAIVLAQRDRDSFAIPVVAPLRVVAINENNSTPAADMKHRTACYDKLYASLDPALLKQANVKYVLAQRSEAAFYQMTLEQPRLHLLKQDDYRVLYEFDSTGVQAAHDPACVFHE